VPAALAVLGVGGYIWWRNQPPVYEGRTVAQWIEALGNPAADARRQAADALVRVGAAAVPELMKARASIDIAVHRRVVAVLIRIGPPAAEALVAGSTTQNDRIETGLVRMGSDAVGPLVAALQGDHAANAARILGLMGRRAAAAFGPLRALAKDRAARPAARAEAVRALVRIGPPSTDMVAALEVALEGPDPALRAQAAEALGVLGPAASSAATALGKAAADTNVELATAACRALGRLDEAAAAPLVTVFKGDSEATRAAGEALVALGPAAGKVVADVVVLAGEEKGKGPWARQLLVSMGAVAVPALVRQLDDKLPQRQVQAADLLGEMGPAAVAAIGALRERLDSKARPWLRRPAARAITAIDPAQLGDGISTWTESLQLPSSIEALASTGPLARPAIRQLLAAVTLPAVKAAEQHEAIARALANIGPVAFPELIEALASPNPKTAVVAAKALAMWGTEPGAAAVGPLRAALQRFRSERKAFMHALGNLGRAAAEAVPDLRTFLRDPDLRLEAALALVRIDPKATKSAVSALAGVLHGLNTKEQQQALVALQRIGPPAAEATLDIVPLLEDADLRVSALAALGAIGPGAREAAPSILRFLRDRDKEVFEAAYKALSDIGSDAVPLLTPALKDSDLNVRQLAILALARMGPAAAPAIPALLAALETAEPDWRVLYLSVLQSIGAAAKTAVPSLTTLLTASESATRAQACACLQMIGSEAKSARDALLECLLDPSTEVRTRAILSLQQIDPSSPEVLAALSEALNDLGPGVRALAAAALVKDAATQTAAIVALAALAREGPAELALSATELLLDQKAPEARDSLPGLRQLAHCDDILLRLRAAALQLRLGDSTTEALAALEMGLQSSSVEVELTAIAGLQQAGTGAQPVLPWLQRKTVSPHPAVRQAAQAAVEKVSKRP
jgi:HEAT repeat protein